MADATNILAPTSLLSEYCKWATGPDSTAFKPLGLPASTAANLYIPDGYHTISMENVGLRKELSLI